MYQYQNIVDKINSQIKYRDFWMPFCPTILDKESKKILENEKYIFEIYDNEFFCQTKIYK